jgi:hypothetical protein
MVAATPFWSSTAMLRVRVMRRGAGPLTAAIALAATAAAHAEDTAQATPDSPWHVMIAPYAWAFGLDGEIGVGDRVADLDASFLDILDESDSLGALQGHVELQYGRFGAFLDSAYADITASLDASASRRFLEADLDADIEQEVLLAEAGLFYRVLEEHPLWTPTAGSHGGRLAFDVLTGVRYTRLDLEVDAELAVNQREFEAEFEGERDWFDPFVGARINLGLTDSIDLSLRGDIGGFEVGSDLAWNAQGLLGYRFTMLGATATAWGGYRALGEDYDDDPDEGPFSWDMILHGPIIGLTMRW